MASGPLTGEKSRGNRLFHGSKNTNRGFSGSHRDDCHNGGSSDDDDSPKQMVSSSRRFENDDDSCSHNRVSVNGRGAGNLQLENLVRVRLNCGSKVGANELRRRLVGELDRVRSLLKRIECNELGNRVYGSSGAGNAPEKVGRIAREMGSVGRVQEKSVVKANQGSESNKKLKKNGGEMGGGFGAEKDSRQLFGSSSKLFKVCSNLLSKLMKHKHGWVFNKPVDAKALKLHDYYTIVKHPMDLGTVKSRLIKNWYKSAEEFAEDVRLTFRNAMLYNPKDQDVHIMADILLKLFEENWGAIVAEYKLNRRFDSGNDSSLPSRKVPGPIPVAPAPEMMPSRKVPGPIPVTPAPAMMPSRKVPGPIPITPAPEMMPSRKVPGPIPIAPAPEMRALDRAQSTPKPADPMSKPKKPKAKEPEKRDMTLEEKQKLSIGLQDLPSEKLGAVVEIIKKRNPALCQQDDEIEVDIDAVDPETLWELDSFVTNYQKSLSMNKRKAELAPDARAEAAHTIQDDNLAPVTVESHQQTETVEKNVALSSPVRRDKASPSPVVVEKQGDGVSGTSSSSSSGTDSSSSSSDSDSNSSSAGSDAGH